MDVSSLRWDKRSNRMRIIKAPGNIVVHYYLNVHYCCDSCGICSDVNKLNCYDSFTAAPLCNHDRTQKEYEKWSNKDDLWFCPICSNIKDIIE